MRNPGRVWCLVLVLAWAFTWLGCGLSPRDQSQLPLKTTPVHFMGMAPKAGEVSFLALNNVTGAYEVFAATKTDGNVFYDKDGVAWYEYDTTLTLPQDSKYWKLGCCTEWPPWYISLKTRQGSVDFYAFDNDQAEACLVANQQTLGGAKLGETCATHWMGDKRTVTLSVPIGDKGQPCGDPNWTKGSCFPGLFCGQDQLCKDTDLYCPSGQIARYDGTCETKSWPTSSDINYTHNYPSDDEQNWTNDIQGIASNGAFWYVSNTTRICRFPAASLNQDCPGWDPGLANDSAAFPASVRDDIHLSNMDSYGGYVYVGAYSSNDDTRQVVTVMSSDMRSPTYAYLGRDEAFLAIHPVTGDLYSITNSSPRSLGVYQRSYSSTARSLSLTKRRMIPLVNADGSAFSGNRFQGGKFSPSGKLYIVFDDNSPSKGGIFVFNVSPINGRLILRKAVDYQGGGYSCALFPAGDREQELEDLLIEPRSSGSYAGDIHQLLLNNDCDTDNYWLKHFKVTSGKL